MVKRHSRGPVHILMALEDEGRDILLAGGRRFADNDIASGVGLAGKAVLCGKILEEGGHLLFMTGFPGNLCDLPEDFEYGIAVHM